MFVTSILLLFCLILPTGLFHILQNPFFSNYLVNLFGMRLDGSFQEARDCFSCIRPNHTLLTKLSHSINYLYPSISYSTSLFATTGFNNSTPLTPAGRL